MSRAEQLAPGTRAVAEILARGAARWLLHESASPIEAGGGRDLGPRRPRTANGRSGIRPVAVRDTLANANEGAGAP